MIDVKIERSEKMLSLCAVGHADYAPFGSDIVCAGTSSVIIGLSSALTNVLTHLELSSGLAVIRCPDTRDSRAAFKVAEKALSLIAAEYPENLKLICNIS